MKIKVLQYNLMRDGKIYPAGSVVDLPEEEAKALVESAPKEFHFAEAALPEDSSGATAPLPDLPSGVTGATKEEMAGEKTLEEMTMAELKEVAKEAGVTVTKSMRSKQAIIDAIAAAALAENEEDSGEEVEGLPGDAE
jgi:hypothetical protein